MTRRKNKAVNECQFVSAMFYLAFGKDRPASDKYAPPRERAYLDVLNSAAGKLTVRELQCLVNIADGVDFDGSSLRAEKE